MLATDKNNTFAWAIIADNTVVGSIGISRKANIHRLTAEIGYYIGKESWDKGVATTSVKLACSHIFENTDIIRIFAEPFSTNYASCRVLEKSGFVYEGLLKSNAIKNGKIVDMKMYAIVKPILRNSPAS